jgi:hypothetical protein
MFAAFISFAPPPVAFERKEENDGRELMTVLAFTIPPLAILVALLLLGADASNAWMCAQDACVSP